MMEERLRRAQCFDALHSLRHTLRVKTRMLHFKRKNIRGQRDGVRSRTVINRVHVKAHQSATKYRTARIALVSPAGGGAWEEQLRVLEDSDVRSYVDPAQVVEGPGRRGTIEEDAEVQQDSAENSNEDGTQLNFLSERLPRHGTGETRKELSWIWRTTAVDIDDMKDDNDDVLRAEWCRSRARSKRGQEQVEKTKEEMRRTLKFLEHCANAWRARATARKDLQESGLREGMAAYAFREGSLQKNLAETFEKQWKRPVSEWATNAMDDGDLDNDNIDDLDNWDEIGGMEDEDSDTEVSLDS